jgi:hypothetical protein
MVLLYLIDLNLQTNPDISLKNFQLPEPMVNMHDIGIYILWKHPALKNSWGEP